MRAKRTIALSVETANRSARGAMSFKTLSCIAGCRKYNYADPMAVVVLPGDGIGPEVTAVATRVLAELAPGLELEERPFGARAIRESGMPLTKETLTACLAAEAVLKGPIGDPEFDAAEIRPE